MRRIVVGISGAENIAYGIRTLELLRRQQIEIHLVMTEEAAKCCKQQNTYYLNNVLGMADVVHSINNYHARICSGSFITSGMIVAPCAMHTLAAIALCLEDNALTRAADVVLKERRQLVLLADESPLSLRHIQNMASVTAMGGVIFPAVPELLRKRQSMDDCITDTVNRALRYLGLHQDS